MLSAEMLHVIKQYEQELNLIEKNLRSSYSYIFSVVLKEELPYMKQHLHNMLQMIQKQRTICNQLKQK